jgi:tRNA(Arg) A34 adenosine deaminase TadA
MMRSEKEMSKEQDEQFMREAITLAQEGMKRSDGGPFGCVIVKDGKIIGRGNNRVTSTNDPTAHAEIVAIREACSSIGNFQLAGCTLYTSCEPCPMCLGAIYWARPDRIVFACTREDAAHAGFDDQLIYDELPLPMDQRRIPCTGLLRDEARSVFKQWEQDPDKKLY